MSTTTIEMLTQRIDVIEKQLATIDLSAKTTKKTKKTESGDDKPKKKRTSGYIIFSNASRDDVKTKLAEGEEKPKNTDVMKELARLWKALNDEERELWNNKAKEIKNEDSEDENPKKKKRTSGYIIFSNASRDDVKTKITEGDEKPKNTEVMKELARQWKALSDEERGQWNEKAKEIKNADE